MVVVAAIGIFTAILAASIAMTQTDIKRVLAYSTLSQLGYMFAALGVGAFTAAIFHLMTHGFFKGLLFLGSGSVIHAVHEEQDMRKMGGLRRKIPQTYSTMLIGAIAISGIPPLAGFFSKDEILGESFKLGFQWVWAIGVVVAVMTAFYMFRLIGLTFWGKSRVDPAVEPKIHESPRVDDRPAVAAGHPVGPPRASCSRGPAAARAAVRDGGRGPARRLAPPDLRARPGAPRPPRGGVPARRHRRHPDRRQHRGRGRRHGRARGACSASRSGRSARAGRPALVTRAQHRIHFLYRASREQVVVRRHQPPAVRRHRRPLRRCASPGSTANVVDGIVNGIGALTRRSGGGLARVQTGRVQNYALGIAIGLIAMAGSYFVILGR